jgi:hypothetical protein
MAEGAIVMLIDGMSGEGARGGETASCGLRSSRCVGADVVLLRGLDTVRGAGGWTGAWRRVGLGRCPVHRVAFAFDC